MTACHIRRYQPAWRWWLGGQVGPEAVVGADGDAKRWQRPAHGEYSPSVGGHAHFAAGMAHRGSFAPGVVGDVVDLVGRGRSSGRGDAAHDVDVVADDSDAVETGPCGGHRCAFGPGVGDLVIDVYFMGDGGNPVS